MKAIYQFVGDGAVLLACYVAAIQLGPTGFSVAQEPAGIPISIPNRSPAKSSSELPTAATGTSIGVDAGNGWLTFEKCMVFASETVDLPFQETGAIASLEVRKNDQVTANQVIAKLEGKVAELEKTTAGLQAQVATSEANDQSEIHLAEAVVEETRFQADAYEEMAAKGNASPTDARQKQLTAKQAEVRLIQSKTAKQQRELKAKLAQSAVFLCQQKVDRMTLKSPIAGCIDRIDHRAGEWVPAGTTIVKIVRLDEVCIDCFIHTDQIDLATLIGKPVKVMARKGTTDSLFSGRITSHENEVSSTGQVRIRATIQNQRSGDSWSLLPGLIVAMQLQKPNASIR
jgi:multidrug resistance efflux pump